MKCKRALASLFACAMLTCAVCAASGDAQTELPKRWEALSEQEKSQVYEIIEKRAKTEFELLEKYAQLGLIDEKKAGEIQKHIEKRLEEMKKEGVFPRRWEGSARRGQPKDGIIPYPVYGA